MQAKQLLSALSQAGFDLSRACVPIDLDMVRYLARHDIVFRSPQSEGFEGLPLGNGDMAAMLWTYPEGIKLSLNKSDAWTQPDEESPMLLRSCGRLMIDFGRPLFDFCYLDDFDARLSLGEARVDVRTVTPFCRTHVQSMICADANALVLDIEYEGGEGDMVRVALERYGSRAFSYWYSGIKRGAECGLGRARADVRGQTALLVEDFDDVSGIAVACAARFVNTAAAPVRVNERRAELGFVPQSGQRATLIVSLESAATADEARASALATLDATQRRLERAREAHAAWWREFWSRSFLHIADAGEPGACDYLENLYYVQLYALACGSRGKYPMTFNGGTFTWNRDIRQWVNPHHWNTQQNYWSVEAANRPELMEPYLAAYERIMPQAREYARTEKGVSRGLAISEMHDFSGRMLSMRGALTPASQIAMQFYNHYRYGAGIDYLRERAYPFLRGCADFYAEFAQKDASGKYRIGPCSPYECEFGENFHNTVVDATMTRFILPRAIEAARTLGIDEDRVEVWSELYEHLHDFLYFEDREGGPLLAIGLDEQEQLVDFGHDRNMTFSMNTSPIVPCPIIGPDDRDTKLYQAVYRAAGGYPHKYVAITPINVAWARLGEGDRALEFILHAIDQVQHFPQGFYYNIDHWFWYSRYYKRIDTHLTECQRDYIYDQQSEYSQINAIRVKGQEWSGDEGGKVDTLTQPFVQCGFEAAGSMMCALQEMFVQGIDDAARAFPALPSGMSALFTLKAAGGFLITGASRAGNPMPVLIIKSTVGGHIRLVAPFAARGIAVIEEDGQAVATRTENGRLVFDTRAGRCYVAHAADLSADEISPPAPGERTNNDSKRFRFATLGKKRMF